MTAAVPVLLATDLPFWRRRTGAEQRIFSLARFANTPPFRLAIWYVGSDAPPPGTELPSGIPQPTWLHAPKGWWPWRRASRSRTAACDAGQPNSPGGLTLADYRWPTAIPPFRRLVRRWQPAWIICEYLTMGYLAADLVDHPLQGIPRPRLCLDTHDLLHRRCEKFAAAGQPHWLRITAEEERAALQPFDLILAIQAEEAEWFRAQQTASQVLVVGHALDFQEIPPIPSKPAGAAVLGYFGSRNASNVDAVLSFAREVWPHVHAACPEAQWLVAGTILDDPQVAEVVATPGIRGQRTVVDLADFYRQVDLVINPVRFGTGLKIKTVEALGYGRPVVTTAEGGCGIPASFAASCWMAATPAAMAERLIALARDPALRSALSRQAEQVARQEFSASTVYRELSSCLAGKP